ARQHTLAFRRAGLHGNGDAWREEHLRRMAESVSPGAEGRRDDAVPGRGIDVAATANAAGNRAGARDESDRAVRHSRRPEWRRRSSGARSARTATAAPIMATATR